MRFEIRHLLAMARLSGVVLALFLSVVHGFAP